MSVEGRHNRFLSFLPNTGAAGSNSGHKNTGLFKMIVGFLTACHIQYTWNKSICFFYLIEQLSKFSLDTLRCSLRVSRPIGATTYSYLTCIIYNMLEIGVYSYTDGSRNCQRAPLRYVKGGSNTTGTDVARFTHKQSRSYLNHLVTKTWSIVLLNKKHTYCYLKYIVYDKLLKSRQSFWITLYKKKS